MATNPGPSRVGVGAMFDRIAPRYDLLNRVLSMGLDAGWRRAVSLELGPAPPRSLRVLDVACGTADLALHLAQDDRVGEVVGVDIAENMLAIGRDKATALKTTQPSAAPVDLRVGDAQQLGFEAEFDVVTIAFGIRNVADPVRGLSSMRQSLKPGGRLFVLEFGEPEGALFGPLYRLYRKHLLPRVGGWVSGDQAAYAYLDETIRTFPSGEGFVELMRQADLEDAEQRPLTLGSVMLYAGRRRAADPA